ncbi:hypothetical protein FPL22_14385 [Rariglobus hedericola]|uniref:Calx-beta domain-containing protein n=1 Tax=Rariglobus hedericola TaxID=2597822 RepID=A0A556QKZ3_9BACT|nr:hypothetical protein [Rariglobus hedericola]TSJ77281.1 hypothetical protein FPL22_14385 [Rariglobus hedericola]
MLIPAGSSTGTITITPIADSLAQGDRTVTLLVSNDYSLSAGTPAHADITIQDKPYDHWRFSRFSTEELTNDAISGPAADPDSDGQPNLLEYALNAEPKSADAVQHTPVVTLADNHLTLTYQRPTAIPDVTYIVEWSGDLQTWSSGPTVTATYTTSENGDGTTTVTERSLNPQSSMPRQFLRLRVTRL